MLTMMLQMLTMMLQMMLQDAVSTSDDDANYLVE